MMTIRIISILFCLTTTASFGQQVVDKYLDFVYGDKAKETKDYKTKLVLGDINISKRRPLIIRTPNTKQVFKLYTFNQILTGKFYKVFITGGKDPFKPTLVTTNNNDTQIDEIQLIGNVEKTQIGREVVEEAIIKDNNDIVLTTTYYKWTLNEKGERVKRTSDNELLIKYRITDNGIIEKIKD